MPEEIMSPQLNSQKKASGSNKNLLSVAIAVLIVLVVAVSIWFVVKYFTTKPASTDTTTPTVVQPTPEIKSVDDLKKLEEEVKKTDINGLSKDLNQNDKDAASF